jgi:hypothetical protein
MRVAVENLALAAQLALWGARAACVLVEALIDRGAENEVAVAASAVERLAAVAATTVSAARPLVDSAQSAARTLQRRRRTYIDLRDGYHTTADPLASVGISVGRRRCPDR